MLVSDACQVCSSLCVDAEMAARSVRNSPGCATQHMCALLLMTGLSARRCPKHHGTFLFAFDTEEWCSKHSSLLLVMSERASYSRAWVLRRYNSVCGSNAANSTKHLPFICAFAALEQQQNKNGTNYKQHQQQHLHRRVRGVHPVTRARTRRERQALRAFLSLCVRFRRWRRRFTRPRARPRG